MSTFRNDSADVTVRPMVDKFEGEGPWPYSVTTGVGTVLDTCGFGAASEAMHSYKKKHKLNLSTIWYL